VSQCWGKKEKSHPTHVRTHHQQTCPVCGVRPPPTSGLLDPGGRGLEGQWSGVPGVVNCIQAHKLTHSLTATDGETPTPLRLVLCCLARTTFVSKYERGGENTKNSHEVSYDLFSSCTCTSHRKNKQGTLVFQGAVVCRITTAHCPVQHACWYRRTEHRRLALVSALVLASVLRNPTIW
jgi:hypothetical protein